MYPDKAFIHIRIRNDYGYILDTCESVTIEKAREVALAFNIEIN